MYFKQIQIAGFKSFADKTEIKFDDGVTAIVGPNGCGKSNVSDAIRWVLGEQSSKMLRGTTMQDVIFNGTEKRKSLSYCEVTLTFNNQDRFFNFDYDELAITRKLYRSGESEYLLNRNPCRLKDIVNILYDSGIGKDGYSIIGQGKVEEIISSKPENRRAIFEEAAGIAGFKSRKVEAERKLDRTRENLTRLRDIIGEIDRQLGPLRKQAEVAKKFLELKGILKDLEVNAYLYQFDHASATKEQINVKLNAILEELSLRQTELVSLNAKYSDNMEQVANLDKKMNELHEEILALTVNIEKQAGETKLIRERINHINEQNDKIELDILNSENTIKKLTAEKEFKENKSLELNENLKALNLTQEQISADYLKVVDEITRIENEAEESQMNMINALDKLSDIKSDISRYEAQRDLLKTNLTQSNEKLGNLEIRRKQQEETYNQSKASYEKFNKLKQEVSKEYADKKFRVDSLISEISDEEQEKHNINARIQVYENRRRLLSEMQAEYEGYAYAVKKILKEAEKNSGIRSRMVGVLASQIKVPEKFETAIEVALGNAVQNIITFDENGAKDLINYLKQNSFGRATFLPISSMKPRRISPEDRRAILTQGSFGVASEIISFNPQIQNVIENLLGATVIVDTLETAVNLAKNTRFSFKIVTLDGDIVNPTGSMTGGSKKSEAANLISREREIGTLGTEIEKCKQELVKKSEYIKKLTEELAETKKLVSELETKKSDAEVEEAKEKEKTEAVGAILTTLNNEKLELEEEIQTLSSQIEVLERELSGKSIDPNFKGKASENQQESKNKANALKEQREKLNADLTAVRVKIASIEVELTSLDSDLTRIKLQISETLQLENQNKAELEKNKQLVEEAEAMIKAQIEANTSVEAKAKLDSIKAEQERIENTKVNLQSELKVFEEKRTVLLDDINKINEKKYNQEMLLSKVDSDLEQMQERIYEEYSLTYQTCLEFKRPDFNIEEGMPEISRIKKEIQKLGYVNVNAIEDSKTLLERYEELSTQEADLSKAEEDLNQIISELSTEMATRFETQFNKINENFKTTFRELFGGGNARLELTESENLLEAGVDIVAEPPGKKLQNITLLSGGEKALTAIAILFAILKLKPMPFCLLDEIEAALDEANVERFAQYLKRFSKVTQFIVITHRKPTMELADSLYGVTMEEKGVSKMVSVKLSEAVKNVKGQEELNGAV